MRDIAAGKPMRSAGEKPAGPRVCFRGASARKPIQLMEEGKCPAGFRESGGVLWTGRISRVRMLASAPRACLNRQAGFTAARPAAKWIPGLEAEQKRERGRSLEPSA